MQVHLVTAGVIRFVLDGAERAMAMGDFCIVPRGSRFGYSNPSPNPARLVLVHTASFDLDSEVFVKAIPQE